MPDANADPTDGDYRRLPPSVALTAIAAASLAGIVLDLLATWWMPAFEPNAGFRCMAGGLAAWCALMAARDFHHARLMVRDRLFAEDGPSLARLTAFWGFALLVMAAAAASIAVAGVAAFVRGLF